MASTDMKTLVGIEHVHLIPIVSNTATEYSVDLSQLTHFPYVTTISRSANVTEATRYADNSTYLYLRNVNSITCNITYEQMNEELKEFLGVAEKCGDGYTEYINMPIRNYALFFVQEKVQGGYAGRLYFNYQTAGIETSDLTTNGDSISVDTPTLTGSLSKWKLDGRYQYRQEFDKLSDIDFEKIFTTIGATIINGSTP